MADDEEVVVVGPFGFPAESLLTEPLPPNYPVERTSVFIKLIMIFVVFAILLPPLFAQPIQVDCDEDDEDEDGEEEVTGTTTTTKKHPQTTTPNLVQPVSNNNNKKKRSKKQKQQLSSSTVMNNKKKNLTPPTKEEQQEESIQYEINVISTLWCCIGCIVFMTITLLSYSPDNYYSPRGVFEAPLFTRQECTQIINMAYHAAQVNYKEAIQESNKGQEDEFFNKYKNNYYEDEDDENENKNKTLFGLLSEPMGWQKSRHGVYPTTDLNIITDPFTPKDRIFLQQKLDSRLSPILERVYGIPPLSIRANDMFVVRYDSNMRNHLANHTDAGSISINILLNDDFEGGGTRFWNRKDEKPFAHVQPNQVGDVLIHSALINHEGMPITSGTRYILVGFLSVDRVIPYLTNPIEDGDVSSLPTTTTTTTEYTGLTWWASWGSLPWCTIKFKDGFKAAERRLSITKQDHWMNSPFVRSLFVDMNRILTAVGDTFLPHFVHHLVAPKNREEYLARLDHAYYEQQQQQQQQKQQDDSTTNHQHHHSNTRASWFKGQQIHLDITGEISTVWESRNTHSHRFSEL